MLILYCYLGFHFFTNEAGGNPMMFMTDLVMGHPEVYILRLWRSACSPRSFQPSR